MNIQVVGSHLDKKTKQKKNKKKKKNKRPVGHKAHQSSSSKLPSPAFGTGMMINAC